ncbi:MAG TPA: hypothetical protein VFB12_05015 [Ktedonobacteraceae bacterium]|nr:hypothetical protein [Ktedonobacteraceae bacterium]
MAETVPLHRLAQLMYRHHHILPYGEEAGRIILRTLLGAVARWTTWWI